MRVKPSSLLGVSEVHSSLGSKTPATWFTRREALATGAGLLATSLTVSQQPADSPKPKMGVVIYSYSLRQSAEKAFSDPLKFLDYCRGIGAGGVQTSIGIRTDAEAAKLADFLTEHKLFLEGSISLPKDQADVERFSAEVQSTKKCGADVFRTVLMNGRRYETFDSADAYRTFFDRAKQALARARHVIEKHELRMAIENHKDLQAEDLLALVKKQDSPLVGVCLDTGNNVALLEHPHDTTALLAPHTFTTHIKDMGVEEYADGFLLSEVPLGTGFLDLAQVCGTMRKANPRVRLNLEMITRDPLQIPCLTPKYWATLEAMPARKLAEALALVRAKAGKEKLPRISHWTKAEQIKREDENVRECLKYAAEKL
jgi:sugar phosphate isomerase/epimerase